MSNLGAVQFKDLRYQVMLDPLTSIALRSVSLPRVGPETRS
jgi:hypothetical protein